MSKRPPALSRRLLPALLAGVLAACGSTSYEGEEVKRWAPDYEKIQMVYVEALTLHGPYRFQRLQTPAMAGTLKTAQPVLVPAAVSGAAQPLFQAALFQATLSRAPGATFAAPATRAVYRPTQPTQPSVETATAPNKTPDADAGGVVSEIRFGVLKHAVALNHTAKETGTDANLEVLFSSPGWLGLVWSPRPTLGLTINGSGTNTDFLYGGLTWEWAPLDGLFIDLGLGFSVHDGMLDNSMIEGRTRFDRREFGCRVLFRESLEFGYRFFGKHSLSAMWAHHSHGSLCSEENEGIDNAGIRYGYLL